VWKRSSERTGQAWLPLFSPSHLNLLSRPTERERERAGDWQTSASLSPPKGRGSKPADRPRPSRPFLTLPGQHDLYTSWIPIVLSSFYKASTQMTLVRPHSSLKFPHLLLLETLDSADPSFWALSSLPQAPRASLERNQLSKHPRGYLLRGEGLIAHGGAVERGEQFRT
jgi:hypothetical protein